jgi:SAM-dependent methyltransferase
MSKDSWNERYRHERYFYGKQPNDFLAQAHPVIPLGNVLCIADGEGRNSVFLAKKGYRVTAVDYSEEALRKASQLADSAGVDVNYIQSDLRDFDFGANQWSGIVSIFCHLPPDLRKLTHAKCIDALAPKGIVLLEAYTLKQLEHDSGGPKDPAFLMSVEQLSADFEGLELECVQETERDIQEGKGHSGTSAVVQLIARKQSAI